MKQKYKLETITPVHIGSGETLNHIDGYYANGRWYHIDLDKVLAHPNADINALTSEMGQRDFRWGRYLKQRNMVATEFAAYSLLCAQDPETTDIRESIKSIRNRPYIPGSSIKGAIRTMLLSDLIYENEQQFDKSSAYLNREIEGGPPSKRRQRYPAQEIEKLGFGNDPSHDLLRALQISDTEPLESDSLAIEMAWTVTLNRQNELVQKIDNGTEYKNFVEVIQAKQRLDFTLKIDDFLFREREVTRLNFSDLQEKTLRDFADVCHFKTQMLLEDERDFYAEHNFTEIANLYDQLFGLNNSLTEGAFMLPIGWGTGYHTNTVTNLFTDGDDAPINSMRLRRHYRLGASRSQRDYYDDRAFPKTRRILYRRQNPVAPLGWIKISPEKV